MIYMIYMIHDMMIPIDFRWDNRGDDLGKARGKLKNNNSWTIHTIMILRRKK